MATKSDLWQGICFFLSSRFCRKAGWAQRWVMKKRLISRYGILALVISGALSIGSFAQTTDEGSGPSEQPSAPMEVGQAQPPDSGDAGDPNAQPTEAQPGGPSGEAPAQTDQGVGRISLIHGDVSTPPRDPHQSPPPP